MLVLAHDRMEKISELLHYSFVRPHVFSILPKSISKSLILVD